MRHTIRLFHAVTLGGILFAPLSAAQAPVVDSADLNARLQRLERSLSSSSLVQMAQTLQQLQREIRELRGELEVQARDLNKLRQRQRDLYLDLDKRLLAMETRAGSVPPGQTQPPGTTGGLASTPAAPATGVPAPAINAAVPPVAPPGSTQASAPAPTPPVAAPPVSNIDPAAEQKAYRDAFELLKSGKFDLAANAMQGFLKDYPNGSFADNAQYWLGEAYYVSHKFDPALTAFERLLVDYPDSPKRSHAMLKIGFIHDESGRKQAARKILKQLIQQYPQSTAAGLARKRLSRLQ